MIEIIINEEQKKYILGNIYYNIIIIQDNMLTRKINIVLNVKEVIFKLNR